MTPHVEQSLTTKDAVLGSIIRTPNRLMRLSWFGTVLWALFVLYFGLRLAIVPYRLIFPKRNWLFVLAILVPALRSFPFLQTLPWARALTATYGMQVVWMFASADQGLRQFGQMTPKHSPGRRTLQQLAAMQILGHPSKGLPRGYPRMAKAIPRISVLRAIKRKGQNERMIIMSEGSAWQSTIPRRT